MRRRERAEDEPKGGLIADQMGLGSTSSKLFFFILRVDDIFRRDDTDAR